MPMADRAFSDIVTTRAPWSRRISSATVGCSIRFALPLKFT